MKARSICLAKAIGQTVEHRGIDFVGFLSEWGISARHWPKTDLFLFGDILKQVVELIKVHLNIRGLAKDYCGRPQVLVRAKCSGFIILASTRCLEHLPSSSNVLNSFANDKLPELSCLRKEYEALDNLRMLGTP